jgi:hypothetical protein
MDWWNKVSDQL